MKANGETRLFPELQRDKRGQWGHPSRWWGRYLESIGVKTNKQVNFHSFRHTGIDALRERYLDHEFKMLIGHSQGDVTGRYGVMPEGPLKLRVEMIESISFALMV
jgi:integrase